MKAYAGVDIQIHIFLTLALFGGEWSASRPCRFTPGERTPGTHWIGGWVDPRADLDDVGKWKFLPPLVLELRPLGRPADYAIPAPPGCIWEDIDWIYLLEDRDQCRILVNTVMSIRLHKRLGVTWLSGQVLVFPKGLCPIELVKGTKDFPLYNV
jgi:hypothetical protein